MSAPAVPTWTDGTSYTVPTSTQGAVTVNVQALDWCNKVGTAQRDGEHRHHRAGDRDPRRRQREEGQDGQAQVPHHRAGRPQPDGRRDHQDQARQRHDGEDASG